MLNTLKTWNKGMKGALFKAENILHEAIAQRSAWATH